MLMPVSNIEFKRLYRDLSSRNILVEFEPDSTKRFDNTAIVTGSKDGNAFRDVVIIDRQDARNTRVIVAHALQASESGFDSGVVSLRLSHVFVQTVYWGRGGDFDYSYADTLIYSIEPDWSEMFTDVSPQEQSSLDVWRAIHDRRTKARGAREIDGNLLEYSLLLRIGSIAERLVDLEPSERSSLAREARYYLEEDRNYIELTRMPVSDYELRNNVFEFHKKLAVPAGCFVFVVYAFPLVLSVSRSGRVYGLLIGITTATVYWIMLVFAQQTALRSSSISPGLIAWTPNFAVLAVAGIIALLRPR